MTINKFLTTMTVVGLITAILMAQSPLAEAQHCAQPVRTVVSYPTISYAAVNKVVAVKEVIKETPVAVVSPFPYVAVPVYSYVNAPGYAGVVAPGVAGSVLQAPQQADADRIADLVFKRLESRLKLTPNVPPDTYPGGPGAPGAPAGPDDQSGGPPPIARTGAKGNSVYTSKAVAFLEAKCANCHSGTATRGGNLSLFDEAKKLKQLPLSVRVEVFDSIYEKRMPKGGEASDQDTELVRIWMMQK